MPLQPSPFPEEAAAEWRARFASGVVSDVDRAAFKRWLSNSENRSVYESLGAALEAAEEIEFDLLEEAFALELGEAAEDARVAQRRRFAFAASIAAVALAGVASFAFLAPQKPPAIAFATEIGERRTVKLPDGSVVELNTNTELRVSQSGRLRDATLVRGEAVFNVERDPDRPFRVAAGSAEITVTGTVFGVSALGDGSSVYVVSGAVDVAGKISGGETLLAGDSIIVDKNGVSAQPRKFDPRDLLAWRHGKTRFSDAPLDEVLSDLNRYFEKPVVAGEPGLAQLPVSGEFDIRDQATALRAVALVHQLDVEEQADQFVLRRRR